MTSIRLLLDENLSEAILGRVGECFPGTVDVRRVLGTGASDQAVWNHARSNGVVLVNRDEDSERLSTLHGAPPKVIWLAAHNPGNTETVALLDAARKRIASFVADETSALLVLQG